jgi:hypothetical protein
VFAGVRGDFSLEDVIIMLDLFFSMGLFLSCIGWRAWRP